MLFLQGHSIPVILGNWWALQVGSGKGQDHQRLTKAPESSLPQPSFQPQGARTWHWNQLSVRAVCSKGSLCSGDLHFIGQNETTEAFEAQGYSL